MNGNSLEQIAAWASGLTFDRLPMSAINLAKRAFLDTIGVSLSGSRLAASRIVAALAFDHGAGREDASVFGHGRKANVLNTALANGTAAHAELFDDNSGPMIAHPSAPLVSALMPLAQSRGKPGTEVLLAYVVGFEVGVSLGRQLNPELYEAGWHVTRVLGVLGAAAASARLIRLDKEQTGAAIGIAASMASGIRQNFGTMTMALHAGLTARDGVHAALLAEAGFGADFDALDGKYGFYHLFGGKPLNPVAFGEPFELVASGIIFKPYPCGAPTHAAVDAALALRRAIGGRVEQIQRIVCLVHPWNFMTLREGTPQDPLRAKVSLRFCVAAALRYGELTEDQFTEACLADMAVRALMDKVEVEQAADLPDNGLFPAEVDLLLQDGSRLAERRDVPPGAPGRPLTEAEIDRKFRACSRGILDENTAVRVSDMVAHLDSLTSIGALCEALEGRAAA